MVELDLVTEQPHERLLKRGPEALTDNELVAIVLRRKGSNLPLTRAEKLLTLFGNIPGLLACDVSIARAQKLSNEATVSLLAALELGRRLVRFPEGNDLKDPNDATAAFRVQMGTTDQEVLGAIFTDAGFQQLGYVECFRGTYFCMTLDTKTILREALCRSAASILLFHYKPGADGMEPSVRDWAFLTQMRAACEKVGPDLVDYFLLNGKQWYSMRRLRPW